MNFFSEKSLRRMSHRAKLNESIVLNDLKYILAADESYNEILYELWDILDLNDERNNYLPQNFNYKEASLDSAETRARVWYYILARIAKTYEGKFWFRKLPGISMISLYRDPECINKLGDEEVRSEEHFVKLDELLKYLRTLESIHEINIPLPKLLFPQKRRPGEKEIKNTGERKSIVIRHCVPGTKWDDVKIALISDTTTEIETPQGKERYSFHELRLSNKKSGDKPRKIWHILKLFAAYNGRLDSNIEDSAKRILLNDFNIDYSKKLPDYTKQLNKHLQEIFGIEDPIFRYHYKKYKAYITKIQFSDHREIGNAFSVDDTEKSDHESEVKSIQDRLGIPDHI